MDKYFEYLLIFKKEGLLKYISHLDLLRLFQRAIRRAELPIVFSKGFHPIPKMKFERALKLGIESEGEKLYIRLEPPISAKKIKSRLNSQLSSEVNISSVSRI